MISADRFREFPKGVAMEMRRTSQSGRPTSLQVFGDDGEPTTWVARGYIAVFDMEAQEIHVAACIAPGRDGNDPGLSWRRLVPEIEEYVFGRAETLDQAAEALWGVQTW